MYNDCLSVPWCLNSDKGGIEMMNTQQPEALRLAEDLDAYHTRPHHREAATELRRLHSVNAELLEALNKLEYSYEGNIKRYPTEVEVNAAIARAEGLNKAQE